MANPDIPLCDLASLNWVSHKVPSYPAYEKLTIELLLPVWYNSVHTHIFFVIISYSQLRTFLSKGPRLEATAYQLRGKFEFLHIFTIKVLQLFSLAMKIASKPTNTIEVLDFVPCKAPISSFHFNPVESPSQESLTIDHRACRSQDSAGVAAVRRFPEHV